MQHLFRSLFAQKLAKRSTDDSHRSFSAKNTLSSVCSNVHLESAPMQMTTEIPADRKNLLAQELPKR